jgi:hypothetical protein
MTIRKIDRFRTEIQESTTTCRANHKERVDSAMEYIKRVEANKTDRTEFNMVIDNMKRIEGKLDLLILRKTS